MFLGRVGKKKEMGLAPVTLTRHSQKARARAQITQIYLEIFGICRERQKDIKEDRKPKRRRTSDRETSTRGHKGEDACILHIEGARTISNTGNRSRTEVGKDMR